MWDSVLSDSHLYVSEGGLWSSKVRSIGRRAHGPREEPSGWVHQAEYSALSPDKQARVKGPCTTKTYSNESYKAARLRCILKGHGRLPSQGHWPSILKA